MDKQTVHNIIEDALQYFYKKRIQKLSEIDIFPILQRKNPYMFRAFGTSDAHAYILDLLGATQSSSDETLFGEFFETVALKVSQGKKSASNSIDVEIWDDDNKAVKLIAVKSGPHIFNAQSKKKQNDAFQESMRRLTKVAVDSIVGYAYGRKKSSENNKFVFREIAGQAFWMEITGDKDFYLELMHHIGRIATLHEKEFEEEWNKSVNKVYKLFMDVFGNTDGSINWDSIIRYNSGADSPKDIMSGIRECRGVYK